VKSRNGVKNSTVLAETVVTVFGDRLTSLLDVSKLIAWDDLYGLVIWRTDGRVVGIADDNPEDETEICHLTHGSGNHDLVSDLRLSPEYDRISYTRGSNWTMGSPRQLHVAPVERMDVPRQLTALPKSANAPEWSPAADRFVFWTEGLGDE
jgi:hypothetical protein